MSDDTWPREITFAELLARIGYTTDDPQGSAECMSLCQQSPGSHFSGSVSVWSDVPPKAARLAEMSARNSTNLWFGVNALGEVASGRGKADDVIRLAALIADLDLKEGACPDLATAYAIIAGVSEVIGEPPVGVTHSGHGLQPYWGVEAESGRAILTEANAETRRQLKRFHAVVKKVAADLGCDVDSVFDLPRVFRVPGSTNYKDPENPVPVRCFAGDGKPMTAEAVIFALDAAGIGQEPEKRGTGGNKKPRGEKKAKDDKPPLYAVSAAMTPGRPSPKVRDRLAKALTDVAIETDRHHKTRDHVLALLRYGYNREPGIGESLEALYRVFVPMVGRDRMGGEDEAADEFVNFVTGAEALLAAEPQQEPFVWSGPKLKFGASQSTDDCTDKGWKPNDDQRAAEAVFWLQRPILVRIHQFARSRRANPYAVLGSVLRRGITLVPPRVQVPATVGTATSVNLLTTNVGRSGQGKDIANGVGHDAVVFLNPDRTVLEDPPSPGIGTGEGLARLFKGYGTNGAEAQTNVHLEVNEVGTLEALADRKGQSLVGELLKAFMGQALGFSNAQKATTTYVRAQTYRLCLGIGAQPENASFFLDREKDGLPQRFLWLPIVNPYALPPPDDDDEPVPAVEVTIPEFTPFIEGAPYLIGVPKSVRKEIRDFHYHVEIGSPDVDPLDGHLMLVRLKVAFGLAILDSRSDISEDDWRIAGQLIELSNRVRADMRRVVADRHRRTNTARAHGQADRETIIAERLTEDRHQRVVKAITHKLKRVGTATRRELQRACDSSIARDFPAAFDLLVDQGFLVSDGGEGNATRWRLASS